MRCAYLTAPRTIVVREEEKPKPRPGEALVRVGSCGVCGSDVHMYRDGHIGEIRVESPHVLGHEFGGVVEDVGSAEDRALVGRKVAVEPAIPCLRCETCLSGNQNCCPHVRFLGVPPTNGGYREYLTCPAHLCEPVPEHLTHDEIACLEPLAIAVHIMDLAKPGLGRSAVILGAGTIGQMTLEMAVKYGFSPLIVTDRLDYRLAMAKAAGATHVVNIGQTDPAKAVWELTGGRGADYVFECTNNSKAPSQTVLMAAPAAKVFLCGVYDEDHVTFNHSVSRRKGLTVYLIRRSRRTLRRAIHLLGEGHANVARIVTHRFPIEEVGKAYEMVCAYGDGVVKAMIKVG